MSIITEIDPKQQQTSAFKFNYLIAIKPLGLLYGSRGRFISPDNIVGRSGTSFPPVSPTLSGVFAAEYGQDNPCLKDLVVAGGFWAKSQDIQSFFVPTPLNILVNQEEIQPFKDCSLKWHTIKDKLTWDSTEQKWTKQQKTDTGKNHQSATWIKIDDWQKLQHWSIKSPLLVCESPWQELPHLHPGLEENERHTKRVEEDGRGSLFLENAVQLNPDVSLVYLSNQSLSLDLGKTGWYRFGGEGHIVEISCHELAETTQNLLTETITDQLALITPAVWGSNHLSYRDPKIFDNEQWRDIWKLKTLITERPTPFRYRLGGKGKNKRLSRGRYAIPAGTVYLLENPLNLPWLQWPESWFPVEGYSFKRWGCGLALPLK
ncbi:hypothetical protein PCC7424_0783 [Gloeothece citriformis PCC 7424]|uniref:CRISPR-associated protein, Cmr3 n=1 Tax=Gloeothece citriformis (strain PCC 7424) TaxID=65393 RepID=B7KH30_GLOC7|nr:type III-B CRISPR module-associated Cmr3 family protein [Gloeothece citriformis]ACK69239.1 hypothetical protein PCC7424_0783 [Gloeothece citriformis PCC 7424]